MEGYDNLRNGVGAFWSPRDFVSVSGRDAIEFLQGQLSQDVGSLAVGQPVQSWLLQPQGKAVALVRATRTTEDGVVLDTDAGWGAAVLDRLTRFKLRVKCQLGALEWRCLALRGPDATGDATGSATGDGAGDGLALPADWPGLPGFDLVGPSPSVPPGVPLCDQEAREAVRIECGVPMMGRELDERTIPQEAGLVEQTVSFTKGCYVGQELVARIDARGGNVPRRLRGVVVEGAVVPPAGAALWSGDRSVGALTSVAWSPGRSSGVALAMVRREVGPPAEAQVRWEGGDAGARIEELPLVS